MIFAVPSVITDIKYFRIPDVYTFIGTPILLLYTILFYKENLYSSVIGSLLAFIIFFLVRFFTKKGIGLGDIKFSILCGFYCGFPDIFISFLVSSFTGILFFIFIFLKNKVINKNIKIPFAPFMVIGVLTGRFFCAVIPIFTFLM